MSSDARDMVEYHEQMARQIQQFMWEGKPFKSPKKSHTIEEFEEFLDGLRTDSWDHYNQGARSLGWFE